MQVLDDKDILLVIRMNGARNNELAYVHRMLMVEAVNTTMASIEVAGGWMGGLHTYSSDVQVAVAAPSWGGTHACSKENHCWHESKHIHCGSKSHFRLDFATSAHF